jgi:hypothetical protein
MHVTTRLGLLVIALAVALAAVAVPAVAQDQQADTMQMLRDKIRVYENYQKEMSALNDRMIKLIREYANNYQTMSDQTAKKLMDEYLAIDAARLKIRQAYVPRFRKVLREKLVARYYQLENKAQAAVNYELAAEIPLVK